MKPRIIVGAFGIVRAQRITSQSEATIIADLKSRYIVRLLNGRSIRVYLSPAQFRIALLLSVVQCFATHEQLTEQLYGEREDGGPESFWIRHSFVFRLRRALAPLGLSIKCEWGRGFELCDHV